MHRTSPRSIRYDFVRNSRSLTTVESPGDPLPPSWLKKEAHSHNCVVPRFPKSAAVRPNCLTSNPSASHQNLSGPAISSIPPLIHVLSPVTNFFFLNLIHAKKFHPEQHSSSVIPLESLALRTVDVRQWLTHTHCPFDVSGLRALSMYGNTELLSSQTLAPSLQSIQTLDVISPSSRCKSSLLLTLPKFNLTNHPLISLCSPSSLCSASAYLPGRGCGC